MCFEYIRLPFLSVIIIAIEFVFNACMPPPTSKTVKEFHEPAFTLPSTLSLQPVSDTTISIAVVLPSFAETTQLRYGLIGFESWPQSFAGAVARDLGVVLQRKGLKVKGPFASQNEMLFSQKKACDLILEIIFDFSLLRPSAQTEYQATTYVGNCYGEGYVSLEIFEPISGQKIWVDKTRLRSPETDCSGTQYEFTLALSNAYAVMLESFYVSTLLYANERFDGFLMSSLKKQASDLREAKVR